MAPRTAAQAEKQLPSTQETDHQVSQFIGAKWEAKMCAWDERFLSSPNPDEDNPSGLGISEI